MHRIIMNCPPGLLVDHINGNGLDNRKENLRIVTVEVNNNNAKSHRDAKEAKSLAPDLSWNY